MIHVRRASPFLLSAARQRAFGLPLSRASAGRASVRRRRFRPFRGGDLLRALPRLHQQGRIVVPALQAVRRPLLWSGKNGFPLLSRCTVPENRCQPGKNSSLDGGRHFFTTKRILSPSPLCITKRALRFPAQRESRKKSHQPSEPGRGGDPRAAGAPQQARISPAKREDARRLAPAASGGQGTRHAIVTPSTTRTRGVRGA